MPDRQSVTAVRIRLLRREKGITQTELAAVAGVQRSCVSNWETGLRAPKGVELAKLCRYFGVSADYIYGRVDGRNVFIAPPAVKLDLTKLNHDGQAELKEYYKYLTTQERYTK